jgi:hypothetical protein
VLDMSDPADAGHQVVPVGELISFAVPKDTLLFPVARGATSFKPKCDVASYYRSENFFRRTKYFLFLGSELVSCDTVKSFASH